MGPTFAEITESYQKTKSTYETARILCVDRNKVYRILKSLNISIIGPSGPRNKISIDETFFSIIDTEEKAYWLGFIAADGCVRKNKSGSFELSIHLSAKDEAHLNKLKIAMKASQNITKKIDKNSNKHVCLRIIRKRITDDLQKHGIVPNKTFFGVSLPELKNQLLLAWIRGYVDGDGSFWIRSRNDSLCFAVVSSTPELLNQIKQFFIENDICGGNTSQTAIHCWRLSYEGAKANKIGKLLYGNSTVHLERKHTLALR
jgi:hypothetical protein